MLLSLNFFFFFQAEDGIRDPLVTGVQTCALPISRLCRDGDLVESTALPEELLGGGEIEARQRGAADRRDRSEPDEPRDTKPLRGALRLDADRLAEPEVLLVRCRPINNELAGLRPGTLDERERVEGRVSRRDAEAEVRCAAVDDRLAVLSDQLRLAVDAPLGLRDRRQAPHLR